MSKYEIILYWSEEDGATTVEAVQNAERVIQEWLETAALLGRTISQPKGRLYFA